MNRSRFPTAVLSLLLLSMTVAKAQYDLKAGNFNSIFVPQNASGGTATPSGPPAPANPPPTDKQFSAVGQIAGAAGPLASATPGTTAYADRYPATPGKTLVLARATIGGVFASGVPRFSLGDVITQPLTQADSVTPSVDGYWRIMPVQPGESFQIGGAAQIPLPVVNVTVSQASTTSATITVVNPPPQLLVGATVLGQPITQILGNTITLAGNAVSAVTSATAVPITPATSYYYSPHADKVFASQAGRVTITWVTRAPDANGNYFLKAEDFAVSATTKLPVRTIYWTEGGFDGPKVDITDSRITTVYPAYYSAVPKAVAQEVSIPGNNPISPNLTTLSFGKVSGIGQLRAYNVEGRILIEYLGNVRLPGNIHESLGTDIVEIVRVPETNYSTVLLGREITSHEPEVAVAAPSGSGTTAQATATVLKGVVTGISLIDGGSGYGSSAPVITFPKPDGGVAAEATATVTNGVVTSIQLTKGGSGYSTLTPSPVLSSLQNAASYYGTTIRQDSSAAYYAERETSAAHSPDDGFPSSQDAYNKVIFYWLEEGAFSIKWPKFQDRYWLRWSPNLDDYVHYTVDDTGGTSATGIPFSAGVLPSVVYQDDPSQSEAAIDLAAQRLFVTLTPDSDGVNRSLLKFSSSSSTWYVNVYSQGESRKAVLASTSNTSGGVTTVTVGSTAGLEVGMVVTGNGISGSAVITRIVDGTRLVISQLIPNGTGDLTYTVQSDGAAPINAAATVGTRLTPPAGHEDIGFISGGTGYYPGGYINPFVSGITAAANGAIIPVNAMPADRVLTVRWFKKVTRPSADFQDLYVPGKVGRYTVSYPATTSPQIVIAQGVGTNDLPPAELAGSIYYQNDPSKPGFNPNEEHAVAISPRAYALRDDLNVTSGANYTSEPFVLLAYTNPNDMRPAMHAYKVVRSTETYKFDYATTAGTLLMRPYPLPLMPEPLIGSGAKLTSKNLEIVGSDAPSNTTVSDAAAYKSFTFKDRKGFTWVHRGPHSTGSPTLSMKLYYVSRPGFFIPGSGEPAAGTILPFLRAASRSGQPLNINQIDSKADGSAGQADEPLTITYRPVWPTDAPELRVAETLTLPKFGLPQVRGQASAEIYYQQSLALALPATGLNSTSVVLHDPTREKTVALDSSTVQLAKLPAALKTTSYQGKTYFQGLPPHLQKRFYLDPLRGAKGTLILTGVFHDELAGEDYLDLNLLSVTEEATLKNLVPTGSTDKSKWDAAVDTLTTKVETFKPDPSRAGSWIVDTSRDVGENDLAAIDSSATAVDSYALTATGKGTGYVTMVFGNSGNPDQQPDGDPVQVKVFKIANQLYTGDLKVIQSSNPLDEQVTLRQSGDFAGHPEDYDFEWRWAPGAATAPAVYTTSMTTRIGGTDSSTWDVIRDPGALRPTDAQYALAAANHLPLPRSENVRPVNYMLNSQGQPTTTVIDETSYTTAEMTAGYPALVAKSTSSVDFTTGVPENIVFSASMGSYDGFVLYVNNRPVLANNSPASGIAQIAASSGLTPGGLARQFSIASSYFSAGPNAIEVAVYTSADPNTISSLNFKLEAAVETDAVAGSGGVWQTPSDPTGQNTNFALVGSSPTLPFGGPQFVLNDRWFTMRYRPKASANNVMGTSYSRWLPPQFVEGWVKRVLGAINPFEQRMKDLYNNQANTDVSVLTQAGTRWEGDIALTMDNINNVGLIEIYETVLNRAKDMSIDANTNDPDANNALLLAAGYLNDLYTILGNEAGSDAANPTISIDDQSQSNMLGGATEVNTSRFSFESQVSSSLEEELDLLRGRTDSLSPGVTIAPAYNRLYWNYTRGINSGEAIYAVNYNIKEKVGSSTADGVIDESDAQRMFPQGHGDAYGHYLTALTGYYRLLTNPNFTWTPRAEAVTVLGQPVTVDFLDERKFAAAAGNVAKTAQQVANLIWRQSFQDSPEAGWGSFRDTKGMNAQTGITSRQGLDEWVSRGAQGAYLNWAVANALVPDVDSTTTGIQKIDRTTVPEISGLALSGREFQSTIDSANAHLNPLGMSPGAIAFDLDPTALKNGKSHYEQISERALRALNNAKGAFDQAARMTRSLRSQQNQLDDYNTTIVQQERAYVNELIDLYGRPYSGDIGAGKLYAQGYAGPDLLHWFIVDRPNDLVDTSVPVELTISDADQIAYFTDSSLADIKAGLIYYTTNQSGERVPAAATYTSKTVHVQPSQWVQYNDVWKTGGLGSRPETGELQDALQNAQQTLLAIKEAEVRYQKVSAQLNHQQAIFADIVQSHITQTDAYTEAREDAKVFRSVAMGLTNLGKLKDQTSNQLEKIGSAIAEAFPKSAGLAIDVTAPSRSAVIIAALTGSTAQKLVGSIADVGAALAQAKATTIDQDFAALVTQANFTQQEVQLAYEYENLYRDNITHAAELMQLTVAHQQALQNVNNVIAKGNRVLAEREIFRQRAAAVIQGQRTKDLTFRIFRNEALEQYRTLFDLAGRYSYLAAKSYDYETGLLGSITGRKIFDRIVASRSLGDLTGGVPQATTSTLGDSGLAGTMAQLNADFSVAKGRLGINNPDQNGTVFSLRSELYRITTDAALVADDKAWQQTLEQHFVANLMNDADVASQCRNLKKPNGTAVPGIVIPFSTTIEHGKNFFGLPLAAGDHAYTPSSFATKIYNVGVALPGYVGMDTYAQGTPSAGAPASSAANALSATPYVYLIPCGSDYMLAPPLGDTNTLRSWNVRDQALPLPYNLGATDFNSTQFFSATGTLNEQPWISRKHQAFRMVGDATAFYSTMPSEFTNSRLIGRSVWNGQWKIVIPAYTLMNNEQEGLNRFAASVKDVQLFLRTYSNSGN